MVHREPGAADPDAADEAWDGHSESLGDTCGVRKCRAPAELIRPHRRMPRRGRRPRWHRRGYTIAHPPEVRGGCYHMHYGPWWPNAIREAWSRWRRKRGIGAGEGAERAVAHDGTEGLAVAEFHARPRRHRRSSFVLQLQSNYSLQEARRGSGSSKKAFPSSHQGISRTSITRSFAVTSDAFNGRIIACSCRFPEELGIPLRFSLGTIRTRIGGRLWRLPVRRRMQGIDAMVQLYLRRYDGKASLLSCRTHCAPGIRGRARPARRGLPLFGSFLANPYGAVPTR